MLTFSVARLFLGLPRPAPARTPEPDPIDHPDIRAMSLRELADLPFPRPAPREEGEDALGAALPQLQETDAIRPAA